MDDLRNRLEKVHKFVNDLHKKYGYSEDTLYIGVDGREFYINIAGTEFYHENLSECLKEVLSSTYEIEEGIKRQIRQYREDLEDMERDYWSSRI